MTKDGHTGTVEAPNGIVCSGGTATDDPLCTEQFQNSAIAALKVVPEPGYGFNGWIVDGAHMELTSAKPLFLATRPVLAGDVTNVQVQNGSTELQADCESQTVYLTFDDGPRYGTDDVLRILNEQNVKGTFFMVGFHTYLSSENDVDKMTEAAYMQLTQCEKELYVEPYFSEPPYNEQQKYFAECPWMKDQVNSVNNSPENAVIMNHSYIHPDPTYHVLNITPTKYYTQWPPAKVLADFTCNQERLANIGASNGIFLVGRFPTKNIWRTPGYAQNDGSGQEVADYFFQEHSYRIYGWDFTGNDNNDVVGLEWKHQGNIPIQTPSEMVRLVDHAFSYKPVTPQKVIVLMHDPMFRTSTNTAHLLEEFIQGLKQQGYKLEHMANY